MAVITSVLGELQCLHTGGGVPFRVQTGQNRMLTLSLDHDWNEAKASIISDFRARYTKDFEHDSDFYAAIAEYGLVDLGWNWLRKYQATSSEDYQWFYLVAEEKVQGVCIIYFPKPSREDGEKIFYIDYIAAAYWNRNRPGYKRKFSGVGLKLINHAIDHAINVLNYRPGFSLHSLPTAEAFYKSLGMQSYECDPSKENLRYFEASEACVNKMLEQHHA